MSALAAADRRDQSRPGLSRHRRPAGGDRGRGRGAARRQEPVCAAPGRPGAEGGGARPPADVLRARARGRADHVRRHRGDRRRASGAAAIRATRSSCSSPTTTRTRPASPLPGAQRRPVTLRPPDFALDGDALRAAIGPRARVLLLNSPHNPTGRVLARSELELIAAACVEHDLICITDEVYEHLVFDGEHIPPATLPGMAERTLTISSVGKSFSFTGWKIGWCSGPAELVAATRAVKQFLTFAGGTPLQHAAAAALRLPPASSHGAARRPRGQARSALRGTRCRRPRAAAPRRARTSSTPTSAPRRSSSAARCPSAAGSWRSRRACSTTTRKRRATLVRFAFCKRPEVIAEAADRLTRLG